MPVEVLIVSLGFVGQEQEADRGLAVLNVFGGELSPNVRYIQEFTCM